MGLLLHSATAALWPRVRNRSQYTLAVVLFAAILPFYYFAWSAPGVGLSHDDGIYLVTAKALATGSGYRIESLPDEIRQTKYPILFPLLLAFVWWLDPVFPQNIGLLKLVPLLATGMWVWGVYRLARTLELSRPCALALSFLVAANPWVISFSGSLRTENLFAALTTWTVIFLLRFERTCELRHLVWAALLAAAAYHTRTAALAIMAAATMGLLAARRVRSAAAFAAVSAALCIPWVLWQRQQEILPPVERYYTSVCYGQENVLSFFTVSEKVKIVSQNLLGIISAPSVLFGFPANPVGVVGCILFWIVCAVGIARLRSRTLQCIFLASVLAPTLWSWAPYRFLFPAAGFLLLAFFTCFRTEAIRLGTAALLTIPLLVSVLSITGESRRTRLFSIEFEQYPATWSQMMDVQDWLRVHARPEDVVVSAVDPFVYLYTHRKSIRGFYMDALPVYYGLPAKNNAEQEFLRVLNRYRPKYLVQMHPDFYEVKFLGESTAKLLSRGYIAEVHCAGPLHVYEVLRIPRSNQAQLSPVKF